MEIQRIAASPSGTPAAPISDRPQAEENILRTLLEYYRTFVRPYLWLYPVSIALFSLAAILYLRTIVPLYNATSEIMVNRHDFQVLDVRGIYDPDFVYGKDFLQAQKRIILSDAILTKAYERMGSSRHLVSTPDVTINPTLRILAVTAVSENAETAAQFANTIVDVYIEYMSDRKIEITKVGSNVLQEQLKVVQENRDKAMADLLKLKQKYGVLDFDDTYRSFVNQKSELASRLFEVQLEEEELLTTIREIEGNRERAAILLPYMMPAGTTGGFGDGVVRFEEMLLEHNMKKPELLTQYNENHIVIKTHRIVEDMIRKTLNRQMDIMLMGMKFRHQKAAKRAGELQNRITAIEKKLEELDKIGGEFRMQETVCSKLDSTITKISSRLNEIEIAESARVRDFSIRCLNTAKTPAAPFYPQPIRFVARAAAGGAAFALAVAVILVLLNNKVTALTDVSSLLGADVPIFGSIPHFSQSENVLLASTGEQLIDEIFRDIRTSLNLSMFTRESRVIALTSALPGEGKTFSVVNLARSIARDNRRVLVMDFDMRRPRIQRVLKDFLPAHASEKGLSNVLVGDAALRDVIVHSEKLNLDVALVGPVPPNPNELIGSTAFAKLLEEVRASYDMVLIDTPPVIPVSDTFLIASQNVTLLLITRLYRLPKPVLAHLAGRFAQLRIRIAGVIANMADVPKSRYSGYPGYPGYESGYGYRPYRSRNSRTEHRDPPRNAKNA